jgi:hypothetical protein
MNLLSLTTLQDNLVKVRVKDIRAVWIGIANTGCLVYVADLPNPFEVSYSDVELASKAMEDEA